jgi:RES domain-containing protein
VRPFRSGPRLILYRISNHADLSGMGGELAHGRWHTKRRDKRIVYLSDHPALCLLEMLAQVDRESDLPDSFQLLSVEVPDGLIQEVSPEVLAESWRENYEPTQKLGDDWLRSRHSLGLMVPSALVPVGKNCLLNPGHPEAARLELKIVGRFPIDHRLL